MSEYVGFLILILVGGVFSDDGSCGTTTTTAPTPTECGENEVATSCRIICPPQTCESLYSLYYCLPTECEPGCDCKSNYLRNKDGVCIPSEDCFKTDSTRCKGDPNATFSECPSACQSSCNNLNPQICTDQCMPPGCVCKEGYVKEKDGEHGKCIKPEDCPEGCNGDKNATFSYCTSHCPLTCKDPEPRICILSCAPPGCECNTGYVLSPNGTCIDPKDCPDKM